MMFESKISVAIFGTCCLAIGLMLGLLVAALTDGSPTVEQNEPLKADAGAQPLPPEPAPPAPMPADWGPLRTIPNRFGPGTLFHLFATKLHAAGVWKPQQQHWSIHRVSGEYTSDVHLDLGVFGDGEGEIEIECIVEPASDDKSLDDLTVTLLFRPGRLADLDQAASHLHHQVLAVGKAIGLSDEERRRLKTFLGRMCLARVTAVQDGIAVTAGYMPARVRDQFIESTVLYTKKAAEFSFPPYNPPAIGAELSGRHAVDLVFAATQSLDLDRKAAYREVGPWWSLAIATTSHCVFTSTDGMTEDADGRKNLSWPRLTIAEIDAMGKGMQ